MKLAILGHSPIALEAALRFHHHGAAVTLFDAAESLPAAYSSLDLHPTDYVSPSGLEILKDDSFAFDGSASKWACDYATPLKNHLKLVQEIKPHQVVSVTKRFLAPGEAVEGKTRFRDLFRVIYQVCPNDFIAAQRESSPEKFERLSQEFVDSLQSTLEMYEDFDLVLDLRTDLFPSSASVTGRALGEGRVSHQVKYGPGALEFARTAKESSPRELALIGSGSLAAQILLALGEWLQDERSRLFLVTTEEEPFSEFLKLAGDKTRRALLELFKLIEDRFESDIEVFSRKLREWQELDDFVQAKIPKPVEPIPQLNFFSGHNVTALDELIDSRRLFLTLERPEFRHGKKHPENNNLDLKTLGVDHILVSHTRKDQSILQLDREEPGFFELTPLRPNLKDAWTTDLQKLKGIEDEIFKLFSAADPAGL
ncbi:MAG TPA: hypothetical protein VNJ01_03615 [Bacteriovoracaceae bacterium]|nr:hypothetical protein [Bacteriovoracaceae bacterium]